MSHARDDTRWVKQGRQKSAVAQALAVPRTASELWRVARQSAPRLQLRDVWRLLQHFHDRGLVTCLNPGQVPGRIHSLTPQGRLTVSAAFPDIRVGMIPPQDWSLHGWLMRGAVRQHVFNLLAQCSEPLPASEIRRRLVDKHSTGLNTVLRTLKDLQHRGLLNVQIGPIRKGRQRDRWRKTSKRFSLRPTAGMSLPEGRM